MVQIKIKDTSKFHIHSNKIESKYNKLYNHINQSGDKARVNMSAHHETLKKMGFSPKRVDEVAPKDNKFHGLSYKYAHVMPMVSTAGDVNKYFQGMGFKYKNKNEHGYHQWKNNTLEKKESVYFHPRKGHLETRVFYKIPMKDAAEVNLDRIKSNNPYYVVHKNHGNIVSSHGSLGSATDTIGKMHDKEKHEIHQYPSKEFGGLRAQPKGIWNHEGNNIK